MAKPGALAFPDVVRASATPFIIAIHATNVILFADPATPLTSVAWWSALVVQSWSRPFVPLFILLSGGLLLTAPKAESVGQFFQRRWRRVGLPYVLWSLIYLGWRWAFHHETFTSLEVALAFLTGTAYYHLWFSSLILVLYPLVPLLREVVKRLSPAMLWLALSAWVGLLGAWPWLKALVSPSVAVLANYCFYIGYFVLGYALWNRRVRGWAWLGVGGVIVVNLALGVWGTQTLTQHAGGGGPVQLDYWFYWALSVALAAGSWFVLLQSIAFSPTRGLVYWRSLSAASLGIYLVHPLVLEGLGSLGLEAFTLHPLIGLPLTVVVTLGLSWALVVVGQRLPGLGPALFGLPTQRQ